MVLVLAVVNLGDPFAAAVLEAAVLAVTAKTGQQSVLQAADGRELLGDDVHGRFDVLVVELDRVVAGVLTDARLFFLVLRDADLDSSCGLCLRDSGSEAARFCLLKRKRGRW